jgi:hypothetical protein
VILKYLNGVPISSCLILKVGFMVMVFSVTFNNISAISWRSVLLVEETGVPGENYRPAASVLI